MSEWIEGIYTGILFDLVVVYPPFLLWVNYNIVKQHGNEGSIFNRIALFKTMSRESIDGRTVDKIRCYKRNYHKHSRGQL
jgi:hypothetical protein